jgi:hypothetical protein
LQRAGYKAIKHREKTIPAQSQVRLPEALDPLIELSTAAIEPGDAMKRQTERAMYPVVTPISPKTKSQ